MTGIVHRPLFRPRHPYKCYIFRYRSFATVVYGPESEERLHNIIAVRVRAILNGRARVPFAGRRSVVKRLRGIALYNREVFARTYVRMGLSRGCHKRRRHPKLYAVHNNTYNIYVRIGVRAGGNGAQAECRSPWPYYVRHRWTGTRRRRESPPPLLGTGRG